MDTTSLMDVNLHELFPGVNWNTSSADKRFSKRFEFGTELFVAEYDGDRFPAIEQFQLAEAKNLSANGIGILSSSRFRSELVVIMIRTDENPIFLKARIIHCHEGFFNRRRQYRIGCKIVGRIQTEMD